MKVERNFYFGRGGEFFFFFSLIDKVTWDCFSQFERREKVFPLNNLSS